MADENEDVRIKDLTELKYKGFVPLDDDEGTGKFPIENLIGSIAPIFDATVNYTARQIVMYQGELCRFKVDHPAGAWNAAHVDHVDLSDFGLGGFSVTSNAEYVYAVCDANGAFLFGVKRDGSFEWVAGVPELIKYRLDNIWEVLSTKVDKIAGKGLVDSIFADGVSVRTDLPEFLFAIVANNDNLLLGIDKKGKIVLSDSSLDGILSTKVDKIPNKTLLLSEIANGFLIKTTNEYLLAFCDKEERFLFGITKSGKIVDCYTDYAKKTDESGYIKSLAEGKKIVWLGTSIPESGYPIIVGEQTKSHVYNESLGSSFCRIGFANYSNDPLSDNYNGWKGWPWDNLMKSLSMTQEEKHYIMECWRTDDRKAKLISQGYTEEQVANVKGFVRLLGGDFYGAENDPIQDSENGEPSDIMADSWKSNRKKWLGWCWNSSTDIEDFGYIGGKIEKYFNSNIDVWMFEHGHNDMVSSDTVNDIINIPANPYNRNYFIGAVNYLVDKILEANPRAKIYFVGHYTNQEGATGRPPYLTEAQEKIASYWQAPLLKLWKYLPFTQRIITTAGYWDINGFWHNDGFDGTNHYGGNLSGIDQNPRQENGIWVHDLTMKQIWLKDDLHPYSDESKKLMAEYVSGWLRNL